MQKKTIIKELKMEHLQLGNNARQDEKQKEDPRDDGYKQKHQQRTSDINTKGSTSTLYVFYFAPWTI